MGRTERDSCLYVPQCSINIPCPAHTYIQTDTHRQKDRQIKNRQKDRKKTDRQTDTHPLLESFTHFTPPPPPPPPTQQSLFFSFSFFYFLTTPLNIICEISPPLSNIIFLSPSSLSSLTTSWSIGWFPSESKGHASLGRG